MSHFDDYSGGNAATYDYGRAGDAAVHHLPSEAEDLSYDPVHDDHTNGDDADGNGGGGGGDVGDEEDDDGRDRAESDDLGASQISFLDAGDRNDPNYLFGILQNALPKHVPDAHQSSASSSGGNSHLTITEQQRRDQAEVVWERVRRWLWANPNPAQRLAAADVRGAGDATCLHLVCKLHNPPEDVVHALIESALDTVQWTDSHGWLPLHHACANGASPEVIRLLVTVYPEGKVAQDHQNRTPLHFYATRNTDNPAAMAANAEILSDSGAAKLTDRSGMLPIHYAAAYGTQTTVLKALVKAYRPGLTATEHNGRTPMHLAMVNAHRVEAPNVMKYFLDHPDSRATINTRDRDGYLPLHLLSMALKGYRSVEPERRNNVADCLSMYLAAEPRAAADFLTAIQDLPDWLQDTAVVSKHVRNILNEKIIQRFPTSILMLDGIFLVVLILCFAVTTWKHIEMRFSNREEEEEDGEEKQVENVTGFPLVMVFVGAGYFFLRELVQFASLASLGSLSSWWTDPANYLDMTVIVLCFYYGMLMVDVDEESEQSNEAFRAGAAFTQGILWVAIIVYLKSTLVDFAVFVGGVFYVVRRLVAFLIAVSVILIAFAQMFYFIYHNTNMCPDPDDNDPDSGPACPTETKIKLKTYIFPHCSFRNSLLKVYTMMMGEIGDETRYSTSLTAQVLYVGYAFLVVILLSNVLIAIVTDSYEIIQNDRAAIVFWSNRLDFVAEMDAITYAIHRRLGKGKFDVMMPATPSNARRAASNRSANNFALDPERGLNPESNPETAGGNVRPGDQSVVANNAFDGSNEYFREAWHQVMLLFDSNLYEDIDLIETWVYNVFRIFSIICVIPVWLALGAVTAGWLWPPQVREYLFVQKETAISRAELERQKLGQLKSIQTGLKSLKHEIMREMANDRDEMIRMKAEVETIQGEVYADLQQVRELMNSLLAA